jgi:putative membrane protein
MGKFFVRMIATSLAILFAGWILPGVHVDDTLTAIITALLLGLLNNFVKPILVFITIPITIITLGFFLMVINVIIVRILDAMVAGFTVNGWLTALLFSFIVSIVSAVITQLISVPKEEE